MYTKSELRKILVANKIPLGKWGKGAAKTMSDLLRELNAGESSLVTIDGKLVRKTKGAGVNVYYRDDTGRYRLREDCQVFSGGRKRTRTMEQSVAEKMQPGEPAVIAAYRALKEELGITEVLQLIAGSPYTKCPVPSDSYPGITTIYEIYPFEVEITEKWYKPEGYVEKQKDKSNYFVWLKHQ